MYIRNSFRILYSLLYRAKEAKFRLGKRRERNQIARSAIDPRALQEDSVRARCVCRKAYGECGIKKLGRKAQGAAPPHSPHAPVADRRTHRLLLGPGCAAAATPAAATEARCGAVRSWPLRQLIVGRAAGECGRRYKVFLACKGVPLLLPGDRTGLSYTLRLFIADLPTRSYEYR